MCIERNICIMRIVKEAEERKTEILDVASDLFGSKGYDGTSMNDIIEKIGIAKGTLYYHFKSKEDILDAIIERICRQMMFSAREVVADKQKTVLERLTKTILALNINSEIGQEAIEQMHRPQNVLMHKKMQERLLDGIVPILTDLIIEGIEEGIFKTKFPNEAVEMIMLYVTVIFDGNTVQSIEEQERRVQGFIYNIERLMGVNEGGMVTCVMKIFKEKVKEGM